MAGNLRPLPAQRSRLGVLSKMGKSLAHRAPYPDQARVPLRRAGQPFPVGVLNNRRRSEGTNAMTLSRPIAVISMGILLSCGVSTLARADIPSNYTLREGTVLSTHIPPTGDCPTTQWQLWIGSQRTVRGTVAAGRTTLWNLSGTYDSHGTFHLQGHETGGAESAGTVDAQVQSNGSLSLRIAAIGDTSVCVNRTIYLPWFRNGNDFDPLGGTELGF
jgi:hypothetical protein